MVTVPINPRLRARLFVGGDPDRFRRLGSQLFARKDWGPNLIPVACEHTRHHITRTFSKDSHAPAKFFSPRSLSLQRSQLLTTGRKSSVQKRMRMWEQEEEGHQYDERIISWIYPCEACGSSRRAAGCPPSPGQSLHASPADTNSFSPQRGPNRHWQYRYCARQLSYPSHQSSLH
jgi:hypothetical protein